MAAYNVWFTKEPGRYSPPQTVGWTVSDNVNYFALSQGDVPAAISEYIAYDTLSPPNPFIAVTQDGTGNVVYDGGFPKFYNNVGPAAGINASITMEFKATCAGSSSANLYYYNAFTDLAVTIAAGDRLVYDMLQDNVNARVGIDAVTAADATVDPLHYSMRDWMTASSVLVDQNGLSIHPATNLGSRAVNQWYHREFDLSQCAGYTFVKWSMAYEGEIAGTFATRFRDVYIVDSTGKIKATLFKDTMKLPGNTSAEAGASGYTNLSKTTYDPRAQLSASFKYLYNAINWCANSAKVAAGSRKILIVGDKINASAGNYMVKSTTVDGFNTSMTNLCAAAGFTPTFKDTGDYSGGKLNMTLAELQDYALVLMFSTAYDANNAELITPAAVSALVTYRSQGNGLIFITDHGNSVMTTIDQPKKNDVAAAGFYATANRVIVNFGCWFTGNYDRTPVNVGFLRTTYGDHPLYSGMADSESISAGASESKVILTPFTKYTKASPPANLSFPVDGRYIVQVTAKLKDGTAETFRVVFIMGDSNIIKWTQDGVNEITEINAGLAWGIQAWPIFDTAGLGTLTGSIYKNTTKIGEISSTDAGGGQFIFYTGNLYTNKVLDGDIVKAVFETPIQFTAQVKVKRFSTAGLKGQSPAEFIQLLEGFAGTVVGAAAADNRKALRAFGKAVKSILPAGTTIAGWGLLLDYMSTAQIMRLGREFSAGNFPLPDANALVYGTTTAAAAAMATMVPPTPKDIFNTWSRFSAANWYPSGTTPPTDSEAYNWQWSESDNSALMPTNSATYVGLVSKEKVENYQLSVTLASSNGDDDSICIILAAAYGTKLETLSLVVNPGGTLVPALNIVYNYGITGSKVLVSDATLVQQAANIGSANGGGWPGKDIRCQVGRRGSNLSIQTTNWGDPNGAMVTNLSLDMNTVPELANLLGKQYYGYGAYSQANAVFKNISFVGGVLWDTVSDLQANKVYRYVNGKWTVVVGLKPSDIYGTQRKLVSATGTDSYYINADGTITKLT